MPSNDVHSEELCNAFVYWWDGEYEGNCELLEGHTGDHYDGISWYNDDSEDKTDEHEADRIQSLNRDNNLNAKSNKGA